MHRRYYVAERVLVAIAKFLIEVSVLVWSCVLTDHLSLHHSLYNLTTVSVSSPRLIIN